MYVWTVMAIVCKPRGILDKCNDIYYCN
jgi:hypothetical protein